MQPKWAAAHGGWAAKALNGHINFHTITTPAVQTAHTSIGGLHAMHQGSAIPGAGHTQDQSSSPKPLSTAAIVKQVTTEQSGSVRGLEQDEEEKASVAGSPTSKFADIWTGPMLKSSLKQAIANQPNSTLAQPFQSEDSDPAWQHLSKAANQQAALPVTSTNPAHPNTPALPMTAYPTPRAQAATNEVELDKNKTVAMGANKQKPQVTKQLGASSSGVVAAQCTAATAGAGSGAVAAQGTATKASAGSEAVAAQVKAETSTDTGGSDVSTAGRAHCSSGHNQDHGRSARQLEIRMVPAGPELIDVEYPLYYKYQVSNHHDKPSKVSGM